MTKLNSFTRKFSKKFKRFINKTFFKSTPKVKQFMRNYFEKNDIDVKVFGFNSITVRRFFSKTFTITVKLENPGLFIGKRGRTIKGLESYLQENLEAKVKIKIKDYYLWEGTYSYSMMTDQLLDEEYDRLLDKEYFQSITH